MNDLITQDQYRNILKQSWAITRDTVDDFPPAVHKWLDKKSTSLGVPTEYVAFPLISSVAYCMGTTFVEVTPDYHEPVITYALVAGRSRTNKSSSLGLIKKLITNLNLGDD